MGRRGLRFNLETSQCPPCHTGLADFTAGSVFEGWGGERCSGAGIDNPSLVRQIGEYLFGSFYSRLSGGRWEAFRGG